MLLIKPGERVAINDDMFDRFDRVIYSETDGSVGEILPAA